MTKSEFLEKYGDTEVTFSSYYKFSFTFRGVTEDGEQVACTVGGNSDDIYRFEVVAGSVFKINSLDPYWGSVASEGKIVSDFYEY